MTENIQNIDKKRMILETLSKQSQFIKDTSTMITISEREDGFINAEIIVESPEKALQLLGFAFLNTAKVSGLIEEPEWRHITAHIAKLTPAQN